MELGNIQKRIFKVSQVEEYRSLEKEISDFYGKPCYWLCSKFHKNKVKAIFLEQEKAGDNNFQHLLQRLYN